MSLLLSATNRNKKFLTISNCTDKDWFFGKKSNEIIFSTGYDVLWRSRQYTIIASVVRDEIVTFIVIFIVSTCDSNKTTTTKNNNRFTFKCMAHFNDPVHCSQIKFSEIIFASYCSKSRFQCTESEFWANV